MKKHKTSVSIDWDLYRALKTKFKENNFSAIVEAIGILALNEPRRLCAQQIAFHMEAAEHWKEIFNKDLLLEQEANKITAHKESRENVLCEVSRYDKDFF